MSQQGRYKEIDLKVVVPSSFARGSGSTVGIQISVVCWAASRAKSSAPVAALATSSCPLGP